MSAETALRPRNYRMERLATDTHPLRRIRHRQMRMFLDNLAHQFTRMGGVLASDCELHARPYAASALVVLLKVDPESCSLRPLQM